MNPAHAALGLAAALSLSPSDSGAAQNAADLVIRGARVITMDPALPLASAVAVGGGRILYVGDDAGVNALIAPGHTRVIDARRFAGLRATDARRFAGLRGARQGAAPSQEGGRAAGDQASASAGMTVLPGLIDAHAHLLGLGLSLGRLDLRGLTSPAAVAAKLDSAANRAASHNDKAASQREREGDNDSDWIQGRGWDQNLFPGQALPAHGVLDGAVANRPVWLRRIDGHAGWANAAALRRAGVTRDTQDVVGGRIVRDSHGEPTGVLIDNAMELVERRIPAAGSGEIERAILRAAELVVSRGLTGVHEMGISPEVAAVYHKLADEGRLPLRVYAYASDPVPAALAQATGSSAYQEYLDGLGRLLGAPHSGPFFTLRGIKLFIDGALGSRGAALLDDYSDGPQNGQKTGDPNGHQDGDPNGHQDSQKTGDNRGLLVSPPEHIQAMARWARLHGWQITTHAIGDRGNRLVLDAYQQAGVRAEADLRFRIEHAQIVAPQDQPRFAALGVIASLQPAHATSDMPWAPARLGPVRITHAYAWQSLLAAGARICGGSDFPVEEADPRLGLQAAVTRQDLHGQPEGGFYPAQRLTLGQAIRAFTSDAAYAQFAENRLGQVMVGRAADLTVLSGTMDLLSPGPPEALDLDRRAALLTVVDGRVVHDELSSAVRASGGAGQKEEVR